MKKIILPVMFSFIIFIMTNQSFAATATVNATAVRMREKASTDAEIVTNLYKEDEVEILEENGEWYKVKYGEKEGYAKAEFFTKKGEKAENTVPQNTAKEEQPQNTTTEQPVENNIENQTATEQNLVPNEENTSAKEVNIGEKVTLPTSVKVRLIPNLSTSAKTEIAQGAEVIVEAKLGNWYKITNEASTGWITKSKFLVEQPAEPTPTVPAEPAPAENTAPAETVTPEPTVEKPQETETSAENTPAKKTAIVIVETARVRKAASKTAEIIDVLDEDDIVTIEAEEGEFYKITSEKIGSGYIGKSLVKEKDVSSRGATEERENTVDRETNDVLNESLSQATATVTGSDVVEFAKQFLGYPYVLRL